MPRFLLVLCALLAGCAVTPLPKPPPDPEPFDPAEACQAAEDTLRRLECKRPDGHPWHTSPKGIRFGKACLDAYQDGRNWNPQCIRAIESCDALEAAYRGELCPPN